MAAPPSLLGDGVTDDVLLKIASYLGSPTDLLNLQLTCPRFAEKCIAAPSGGGGTAAAPEMLSIPEEAARRWVAGCSEQVRGWVPRRELESWLGLMHEVGLLRVPLAFGRAHTSITLSENGTVATKSVEDGRWRSAASKVMMRSGRHFAQFTVVNGNDMNFGVIRPGCDVEGGADAAHADGHCIYDTYTGSHWPGPNHDWEGQGTALGDRVGMLLDLDQGSMTVYKDDEKMGVMVAEGLSGPLCWAVSYQAGGFSARIESAPAPASPTEEELELAREYARQMRRQYLGLPPTATDAECDAADAAAHDDY